VEVIAVCHACEYRVGSADAGVAKGYDGDQGFYGAFFGCLLLKLIMGCGKVDHDICSAVAFLFARLRNLRIWANFSQCGVGGGERHKKQIYFSFQEND
jgi:hypothetical protein